MIRSRRGYTLVEMLATSIVVASVLATVTCWLVSLLRGESAGRDHLLYADTQDRLARQFREDVHAAIEVDRPGGDDANALLRLELGDLLLVEYHVQNGRLSRIERSGDEVVRREEYRLPPPGKARIELSPTTETSLASLLVEQGAVETKGPDNTQPTSRTLRIDAQRGLYRRIAGVENR